MQEEHQKRDDEARREVNRLKEETLEKDREAERLKLEKERAEDEAKQERKAKEEEQENKDNVKELESDEKGSGQKEATWGCKSHSKLVCGGHRHPLSMAGWLGARATRRSEWGGGQRTW